MKIATVWTSRFQRENDVWWEISNSTPIFVMSELKTSTLGLPATTTYKRSTRLRLHWKSFCMFTGLGNFVGVYKTLFTTFYVKKPQRSLTEWHLLVLSPKVMTVRSGVQGWSLSEEKQNCLDMCGPSISYVNFTLYQLLAQVARGSGFQQARCQQWHLANSLGKDITATHYFYYGRLSHITTFYPRGPQLTEILYTLPWNLWNLCWNLKSPQYNCIEDFYSK